MKHESEGKTMNNRIIGVSKIKQILLEQLKENPDVSQTAVQELNDFLSKLVLTLLQKANEYRKIKNPNKRLSSDDIKQAIKDLNRR